MAESRIIKKYPNRRLYDTEISSYITLEEVRQLVVDGEKFEGGSAEGATLVIGSGRFIPGFEDQLIGASAGDELDVKVTFPEDYQVDTLKGKPAVFATKVKEVKAPKTPEVGEEFAKTLGLENLDALRNAVKTQLSGDLNFASRQQVKRVLLDALES